MRIPVQTSTPVAGGPLLARGDQGWSGVDASSAEIPALGCGAMRDQAGRCSIVTYNNCPQGYVAVPGQDVHGNCVCRCYQMP